MDLNSTTVRLIRQSSYDSPQLDQAVDRIMAATDNLPSLRTAKVLLKPNLITANNGLLACTDGRFIASIARWFLAQGACVSVGDSPSFGSARSVLAKTGTLPLLQALAVPVQEFRQSRELVLPSGHKAALATAALDCDLLVNLPRVKAHAQMRVTLAVKNCFGCLAGFHKPWWHMAHGGRNAQFPSLLVELLSMLPASCTVVDGIVAMHVSGPVHGEPFALGVMAGGANPVAIDTALLDLLSVCPTDSPLWLAARQAKLAGTELGQLVFPWATPESLKTKGFIVPGILNPIRFNPFRFVKNSLKRVLLQLKID